MTSTIAPICAVGGIAQGLGVGDLVVPDQLVDYTWGRAHAYNDHQGLSHYDFSDPFDASLRRVLVQSSQAAGVACTDHGT